MLERVKAEGAWAMQSPGNPLGEKVTLQGMNLHGSAAGVDVIARVSALCPTRGKAVK